MDPKKQKKGRPALGRGLSALISSAAVPVLRPELEVEEPRKGQQVTQPAKLVMLSDANGKAKSYDSEAISGVQYVSIASVSNNPEQPRQDFSEQDLSELTNSIRTLGVLQPILVRPKRGASGQFEIVAGERRWRAAERAALSQVPVIIKEMDDRTALELALVENIQRADLGALELARAYHRLIEDFGLTQDEVAERVGKDRASVANYVRLLKLPADVQKLLSESKISMGHARAILTVKEPTAQLSLAQKVIKEGLSVRSLEEIVARVVVLDRGRRRRKGGVTAAASDYPEVTDRLRKRFGTKVAIRHHASGRGKIELEYFSEQELERLVELLDG